METPDATLYHMRKALITNFITLHNAFREHPNNRNIILDVSTRGLSNLLTFMDTGNVYPKTVQEWIEVMDTANYLEIRDKSIQLRSAARLFFLRNLSANEGNYKGPILGVQDNLATFPVLISEFQTYLV